MEFVTRPRNPLDHGELQILPVFSDISYDGGPFLSYLERYPNTLFSDDSRLLYLSELEIHYQNWLFFGLLHEFLGDLYDERDFIVEDEESSTCRISTHNLRDLLQRWHDEKLDQILKVDPGFSHWRKCLEETWKILELTERSFPDHGERLGLQIDLIAAVAEALTKILRSRHREFSPGREASDLPCEWLIVSYQGRRSVLQECIERMIKLGGWCPNDIQMCVERFKTVDGWHYLRHLRLSSDSELHKACDTASCRVATSNNATMIPKHTKVDCRCESVRMNHRRLTQIYKQGCIPCVELSTSRSHLGSPDCDDDDYQRTNLKVRLRRVSLKMKSRLRYVAISHVWGNGTGNGHANSLPLCQLSELYDCIRPWGENEDGESSPDNEPTLVWIDTLCCPYQPGPGKRLALTNMKEIYQNASAVHIWDRCLLHWDSQRDFLEFGIRLLFSHWMRRLWTAQEAIFAGRQPEKTLIAHCADRRTCVTSIYRRIYRNEQTGSLFSAALCSELVRLEKVFWPGVGGFSYQTIGLAANLLQYRSTSVAADEPLVLANILGFPVDHFIGLSHEEGMCKFWSSVGTLGQEELQKGIPFCPTPKLTTPGFRWAPRTFMNPDKYLPDAFFNAKSDTSWHAELTARGLVASFRGFRVVPCPKPTPRCLLGGDVDSCLQNYDRISFQLHNNSWLRFGSSIYSGPDFVAPFIRMYKRLRHGTLTFISQMADIPEEPVITHGLVAEFKEETNGTLHVAIDGNIGIDSHRYYPVQLHAAAKKCALEILRMLDRDLEERKDSVREDWDQHVQEVFDRLVRQTLLDDAGLCKIVRSNSRDDLHAKKDWTFDQVFSEFRDRVHHHAHVGAVDLLEYPKETMWCLD